MSSYRFFIVFFLHSVCCTGISPLFAAAPPEQEATSYFEKGQYVEALRIWYGMVENGRITSGLYFNIGLAEAKLGQTAKSILAFERALKIKPANAQIQKAIETERKKIEQAVIPVRPFFLSEWYKGFLSFLRPGVWTFLGLVLLLAAVAFYVKHSHRSGSGRRNSVSLFLGISGMGIALVLIGWLSYQEMYVQNGAIVHKRSEFRQAPSAESPLSRVLNPGEKVVIRDKIGDWYYVSLLNLDQGWIKEESLWLVVENPSL